MTFDSRPTVELRLTDLAIGEYGVITVLGESWSPELLGHPFVTSASEIVFLTKRVWAHRNNCTARCRRLAAGEVVTITGDGK